MGSYSDHWIIERNENDAILEAKQRYPAKKYQLDQDPDVLDTWFSSGLFPISVLGWPDDKPDLVLSTLVLSLKLDRISYSFG